MSGTTPSGSFTALLVVVAALLCFVAAFISFLVAPLVLVIVGYVALSAMDRGKAGGTAPRLPTAPPRRPGAPRRMRYGSGTGDDDEHSAAHDEQITSRLAGDA